MKFTGIINVGQIDIFPHITISLGYIDEFGSDCENAILIFVGWFVFDLCIEIPRKGGAQQ